MLVYLDNFRSIGPKSVAGLINRTGLNENFAREILELHTLGVRTVYTPGRRAALRQGDHRLDLAADGDRSGPRQRVRVQCAPARAGCADRDRQELSGRRRASRAAPCWPTSRAIRRPPRMSRSSSRAISAPTSRRLRWWSDWPRCFLDTDGDLKEMAKALIEAPETWDERRLKLKRPSEWMISVFARARKRVRAAPLDGWTGLSG